MWTALLLHVMWREKQLDNVHQPQVFEEKNRPTRTLTWVCLLTRLVPSRLVKIGSHIFEGTYPLLTGVVHHKRPLFLDSVRYGQTSGRNRCVLSDPNLWLLTDHRNSIIIININPLTSRVVGAPQMIFHNQFPPVFSVLHCLLGLGQLQACPFPDVVFPSLCLSA